MDSTLHELRDVDVFLSRLLAYWRMWRLNELALLSRTWHRSLTQLLVSGTDQISDLFVQSVRLKDTVQSTMRRAFPTREWRNETACLSIAKHMVRWRPVLPQPDDCDAWFAHDSFDGRITAISEGMTLRIASWYRQYWTQVAGTRGCAGSSRTPGEA